MTMDDEEEERQRQALERSRLNPLDRLYGKPAVGMQGLRRRGRVVQMPLRMQLRVRAILEHIMQRDAHDSLPVLFEVLLELYLEKHGAVDERQLPSDDELIARYLKKEDDKYGR